MGGDGERMDSDYNGARGIYLRALGDTPRAESLALCVRHERGQFTSQRKCEGSRVSVCSRKLLDVQRLSRNFYRLKVTPLWVLRNADCPSTAYGYYCSHFQLSLMACNYHRHQVDALWSPSVRKSNQTDMVEAVRKY